jgi:hypothetical protein
MRSILQEQINCATIARIKELVSKVISDENSQQMAVRLALEIQKIIKEEDILYGRSTAYTPTPST